VNSARDSEEEMVTTAALDVDALIDDRPDEGVFRVNRRAFTDPKLFDLEMRHIFEATWVFVGLESQVAAPHDFFTASIGRQPVIVSRDGDGKLGCFLNTCRHRGAQVCPWRSGNRKYHVCPYHGWSYDSGGRNVGITHPRDANYPTGFADQSHDLVPVARFEGYKGLLFASLSPDVPSLEEHLGEARAFIDMVADQSPQGLELVPGPIGYTFDGNWKLQFENGLDFYHFASTHASYIEVVKDRRAHGRTDTDDPMWVDGELDGQGTFSFDRGHAVMYSNRNSLFVIRPIAEDAERFARLREQVGPVKAKWMMFNRNLTIYPNLQLIDVSSLQLRVWRPLAVDRTEMISHCLAPIGESAEARRRRIRQYEDFFNPSGLATADDNVMYEHCQTGLGARAAGWTQGYLRGLGGLQHGPGNRYVEELGLEQAGWIQGSYGLGDETCFHPGYREWRRLLSEGLIRDRNNSPG